MTASKAARSDAGGSAGAGGFDYQHRVAAWLAVTALAGTAAPAVRGLWTGSVQQVACETGEPVDDCRVDTSDGITLVLQAKRTIGMSIRATSEMAKTAAQFVQQHLLPGHAHERLVLVTSSEASGTVRVDLAQALDRLRGEPVEKDVTSLGLNATKVAAHNTFVAHVRRQWEKQRGTAPSAAELRAFLACCYVWTLDVESGGQAEREALGLLRMTVLSDAAQAEAAWNVLLGACAQLAILHSGADVAQLQEKLSSATIALATIKDFTADVELLTKFTKQALDELDHGLTTIPAPHDPVAIERSMTTGLDARSQDESFLLVGEPGAGKTVVLHGLAREVAAQGRPLVFMQVSSLAAESIGELRTELGLQHSFVDVLAEWSPGSTGLLIIDALDAARADASAGLWRTVIDNVSRQLPRWRVVASIRTWDLQHSSRLRTLFPGAPVLVEDLTDDEVKQVSDAFPALRSLLDQASEQQRRLMLNTFNLRLAAELLLEGSAASDLRGIDSRLDLLDRYWQAHVSDGAGGTAREALLVRLCAATARERKLAVPAQTVLEGDIAAATVLDSLLSRSVLSRVPLTVGNPARGPIQFAHHVLFDYAVGTVYFDSFSDGLTECLRADPDLLLFARPSIDVYLQMAWKQGAAPFYTLALELMATPSPSMTAPAIADVVVRNCSNAAEIEPLLAGVPDSTAELKRLLGAIAVVVSIRIKEGSLANPGVWADAAERLSRAPEHAGSALGVLITDLASHRTILTTASLQQCGLAARRLLEHIWTQPPTLWARLAIPAVIQTATSDPQATETLLRRALEPPQLQERGYNDLVALTHEVEQLTGLMPVLVEDLYVTTLSHEENSSETTQMGSGAVLTLLSNRRQDFGAAKYPLVQYFPDLLRTDSRRALSILTRLSTLGHTQPTEHQMILNGHAVTIQEDGSHLTDFGTSYANDDPAALFNALQDFASNATAAQTQELVEALTAAPQAAVVWRRVLLSAPHNPALADAFFNDPATLVTRLLIPELAGPASTLTRALHPTLGATEAGRLEAAVLALKPLSADDGSQDWDREDRRYRMFLNALSAEHLTDQSLAHDHQPQAAAIDNDDEDDDLAWAGLNPTPVAASGNPADETVQILSDEVRRFTDTYLNGAPTPDEITSCVPVVTAFEAALVQASSVAVRNEAENLMAKAAEIWTRTIQAPPSVLDHARSILLSLKSSPRPEPTDQNANYTMSIPQGPRTEAARGLGQLCLVPEHYTVEVRKAILELAADPVGQIRHTIAKTAPFVARSSPDTAWELLELLAQQESDDAVLSATVEAAALRMSDRHRGTQLLAQVAARVNPSEARESAASTCATVAALLWVYDAMPEARTLLNQMIDSWPGQSAWSSSLHILRSQEALTHNDPAVRKRALDFMHELAELALRSAQEAIRRADQLTDSEKEQLKAEVQLLDGIAFQLFSGSGAIDREGTPPTSDQVRLVDEADPVIQILAQVPAAPVTHHLVEIYEYITDHRPQKALLTIRDIIKQAGTQDGYTMDPMGLGTCVKFVERILADHRGILHTPENLTALREICDAFIDAGWPQAHQLVFGIEQIFR
ncbi:ATP-binding protein [Streptomyces sp. NPDC000618]|uniref:ATP-binding protein n=1 Tax=Streptomyces sp. NPDC000618 TaxID=3154265 RepID=UPI00331D33C7